MRLFFSLIIVILVFAPETIRAQGNPPNLLEQLNNQIEKTTPSKKLETSPGQDALLNKRKKKLPYKSYDEIPEEIIVEAEEVFEECMQEPHRSAHYDCECMSMRFIEERIIQGPLVQREVVLGTLQGECPNTVGAAGFAYTACMNTSLDFFPKGQDPDEYCSCVGNSYAKLFERAGRQPDSRTMVQLRVHSRLNCIQQPPGVPPLVTPVR